MSSVEGARRRERSSSSLLASQSERAARRLEPSRGRSLADPALRCSQYWVSKGYVVVRIDERGIGSSPGFLDTMSASTSSDFAECVEWAAAQDFSTGKVGLLGISYYGGTQWRVAARKPKGLACIIPWEGASLSLSPSSPRLSFCSLGVQY